MTSVLFYVLINILIDIVVQTCLVCYKPEILFTFCLQLDDFNVQVGSTDHLHLTRTMTFRGHYYFSHHRSIWYTVDDPAHYWM